RAADGARTPIAAVNGDYFIEERGHLQGMPIGAAVSSGEILHSPYPRSALILRKNAAPRIAILRMNGDVVRADGTTYPIQAVNHPRGKDALVLYTSRFGPSTRTQGGVEAVLDPESLPLKHGEFRAATIRELRDGPDDAPIAPWSLVL